MKNMTFKLILFFVVFPLSLYSHSQIYKCKDQNNKIHFSDRPCDKGFEDKSNEVNTQTNVYSSEDEQAKKPIDPSTLRGKAVVRLKNGETVELTTKTMKSRRGMTFHQLNNLMLPNGVDVKYTKIKSIVVLPGANREKTVIKIDMLNGKSSEVTIPKPITYVSGETEIGRFSEQLYEIKEIRFY